ncbi:DNA replication/repair protein RecF [Acaryochloris sp. 'Moss Beach']|uniref:DNA replication/repair protein RecF n=1 Tax=Acaryochloris TaxID=155977 RepID=UPI001BAEFCE1|nr:MULTISPECIES: DNA replication/repair protein RecF [Acaryochloris]QUY41500.1 DNA replication/repair protein RecF [Acaryochloris marina S15]UJB70673.1 DNA replication/repair protein RecF [Acaryochloris sp. 'Moss Beach']
MYLQQLHLIQFRNYVAQQVEFSAPKTILVGPNAQGKSNLLEAVELLSTLKSHRVSRDRDLVKDGESLSQVTATLQRESGPLDLSLTLRANGRRTVSVNSETIRRQLDFLGHLNIVQFSSLDMDLVRGGPGERRNWLDAVLVQLEPVYAHLLQQYQQVLKQRNAYLKHHRSDDAPQVDPQQLVLWNQQLAASGSRVIQRRQRMLMRLVPLAGHWHQTISGHQEQLEILYTPNVSYDPQFPEQLYPQFLSQLEEKSMLEQLQGLSLVGPHRDEVTLLINGTPARQYGSQGQQRTLVLALKLAELKLIEEVVGEAPLLLLDDVLAELDLNRQNQLLDAIQTRFQTLITTTHLGAFDAKWLDSAQILTVKAGQVQFST